MNKSINESNLNKEEFEQLLDMYIDTILDSMSMKDLYQYVYQDYEDSLEDYTLNRLLEEIKYTLDDEMLEEFVTEIENDSKD